MLGQHEVTNSVQQKRAVARRNMLGDEDIIARYGFIDTIGDAVLSSPQELAAAEKKAKEDCKKRNARVLLFMLKELRFSLRASRVRSETERMREAERLLCARLAKCYVYYFKASFSSIHARQALDKTHTYAYVGSLFSLKR